MNLIEKLFEIQKSVSYIQKNAQGYQYRYASGTDVLAPIRSKMDELKVMLFPHVTDAKTERGEMVADGGKTKIQFFTEIRLDFVWVDVENPTDKITVPFYAQGVDPGEKGVGKAWTYAERYFMLKFFHIPTDQDDPDRFQEKRVEAGKRQRKAAVPPQAPPPMEEPGKPHTAAEMPVRYPSNLANPWKGKVVELSDPVTGTTNGRDWTKWEIRTTEINLICFDRGVAEVAANALQDNSDVQIVWKLKKNKQTGNEACLAESIYIEGSEEREAA